MIYVVKPGTTASTESTAKVIRKGTGVAELFDASFVALEWVVAKEVALGPSTAVTAVPVVVPAECADLRACLKRTPLNLPSCAGQAVSCKPTVASGAKLEHGDKKVDLFTLGLAALFGSDERGVFVVSKDDDKKGKRLFVATDETSVVDVEYDEDKQTWREPKGTNWILIGSSIGGGVVGLIILAVVLWYLLRRSPQPTVVALAPPV